MKFDLELFGEKEFFPKLNNKKYLVLKIDNNEKEQYMYQKFNEFINKKTKRFIGMDFEYNKVAKNFRNIALMQINMEDETNIGQIYVIYPPKLKNINLLIKLLTEPNIIKILHGGESLDIPYLFDQLFKTKKLIDLFCNNMFDTKYMCDYMNIINNMKTSCSIYNLLETNKVISSDKLNSLNNLSDNVDISNINDIDIMKLDINVLKYALYDVLYLPELLNKFFSLNNKFTDMFTLIIPEITAIINKHKRGIENYIVNIEPIISKLNNNRLYGTINMKELWDVYNWLFDNKLKEINYFKKIIELFTKIVLYSILVDNNELNKFLLILKTYYPNIYKLLSNYKNKLITFFI